MSQKRAFYRSYSFYHVSLTKTVPSHADIIIVPLRLCGTVCQSVTKAVLVRGVPLLSREVPLRPCMVFWYSISMDEIDRRCRSTFKSHGTVDIQSGVAVRQCQGNSFALLYLYIRRHEFFLSFSCL